MEPPTNLRIVAPLLAVIGVIQVLTLGVMLRPTETPDLVCRGLFETPNAITCSPQKK